MNNNLTLEIKTINSNNLHEVIIITIEKNKLVKYSKYFEKLFSNNGSYKESDQTKIMIDLTSICTCEKKHITHLFDQIDRTEFVIPKGKQNCNLLIINSEKNSQKKNICKMSIDLGFGDPRIKIFD